MSRGQQSAGRSTGKAPASEGNPAALRYRRPEALPRIDGEIVDISHAIRRIERPSDDRSISDTPAPGTRPAPPPYDPAAPLDLSVWSARETRRLLATLIRQRISNDPAARDPLSVAGQASDTVCTAIAQWLGEDDKVVTSETAQSWDTVFFDNGAPRGSVPPVIEAGPSAAIEAAMAARTIASPDVVVAIAGGADKLPFGLSDAAALAAQHRLPVLFVATRGIDVTADALPGLSESAVGRLMTENGLETAHVDGNDVIAASEAAGELIHAVRCGRGAAFLQAACPAAHAAPDPIDRLRDAMLAPGDIDGAFADKLAEDLHRQARRERSGGASL